MTMDDNAPLDDDDMVTSGSEPMVPPTEPGLGGDADGTDAGDADGTDGDGTDGDSTDGTDGDASDGDGTDGGDADGTDGTAL